MPTPLLEPTPTLLEFLAVVASDYDAMVVTFESDEAKRSCRAAASHARAAAARLREEWTKANARWHETTSTACRELLLRVNGGPLPTPEEKR